MTSVRRAGLWVLVAGLGLFFAGCSTKTLDPTQIGRFRSTPAVNVILDSLGVAEEPTSPWANAEEPKPEDVKVARGDYRLRSGDVVRIGIFELYQDGQLVQDDYTVSETGKIMLPVVGVVQAAGQTEVQLQSQIRRLLMPNVLRDPSVTVALQGSPQRRFSILGNGVPKPGAYAIPSRPDFRVSEALALAGGPDQYNVSTIYVTRPEEMVVAGGPQVPFSELELITPQSSAGRVQPTPTAPRPATPTAPGPGRDIPEPSQPAQRYELEREMLDLIAPSAQNGWPESDKVVADAEPVSTEPPLPPIPTPSRRAAVETRTRVAARDLPPGFRLLTPESTSSDPLNPNDVVQTMAEFGDAGPATRPPRPSSAGEREHVEWDYRNGRWVLVEQGPSGPEPVATQTPGTAGPTLPGEDEWADAIHTRLLKIPVDKLHDPRYDIVIKPGDTIHVPVDLVGEFWIGGNVVRSGAINMTGRPMTLKMAIAAAGGLGPLAYPKYCEVIRRVNKDREEIVMVDLDKIASGELPDFFIKPNDLINVGTHPTSRWRAVLRNSFRSAYGFAFVYDRNFADADYGDGLRVPDWF